jgi:hypothetical protein
MGQTGVNSNLERAARIANATDAEREAARQDYIVYARANRDMDSTPEPFQRYLSEWLDCRRVKLPAGEEPDDYGARDYRQLYGG